MQDGYFSSRYRLRPQSHGLICEQVPESARTGLCQILENYFQSSSLSASQLYFNVSHALHIEQENVNSRMPKLPRDAHRAIGKLIMECEWWQFYDICEVIPRSLKIYYSNNTTRADFHKKINALFKIEKLGFEVTEDGLVEKVDTSFTDASIKNTRYLVEDPNFKEAGELFEKSLQEVYYKTQPDFEKCINDTLLAAEVVARTVNNGDKKMSSFNEIINNLAEKELIPQQIARVIYSIYLSIGDHHRRIDGMNGSNSVGVDEAEFVLALTAAIITYLVTKSHQLENAPPDLNNHDFSIEYQPTTRK